MDEPYACGVQCYSHKKNICLEGPKGGSGGGAAIAGISVKRTVLPSMILCPVEQPALCGTQCYDPSTSSCAGGTICPSLLETEVCNGECFDPLLEVCANGEKLCDVVTPLACGSGVGAVCYSNVTNYCVDGVKLCGVGEKALCNGGGYC